MVVILGWKTQVTKFKELNRRAPGSRKKGIDELKKEIRASHSHKDASSDTGLNPVPFAKNTL